MEKIMTAKLITCLAALSRISAVSMAAMAAACLTNARPYVTRKEHFILKVFSP